MRVQNLKINIHCSFLQFTALLLLMLVTACSGNKYLTDLSANNQLKSGMMRGYLTAKELPNSLVLIPPPPEVGSTAFLLDQEVSEELRRLSDSSGWQQAISDANLEFPEAIQSFSEIVNIPINNEQTPYLYIVLQRSMTDAAFSTLHAKKHYNRPRPFMLNKHASCTPEIEEQIEDGSYPSGHAAIGWTWALILSELFPDQSNRLMLRGREFGESRMLCNLHWQSDVSEGRFMGAATVARLHANPNFMADLEMAKKEVVVQLKK